MWDGYFLKMKIYKREFQKSTNSNASNIKFHSFSDIEENVRNQIKKIRSSPFLSNISSVHGFIYDIRSGKIREVQ